MAWRMNRQSKDVYSRHEGFLINEAWHKRWFLDKGHHYIYDSRIYGDTYTHKVIQASTDRIVEEKQTKLGDGWEQRMAAIHSEFKRAYGD